MRDSFIFYRSFYEAISDLPDTEQLQIYKAISAYSLNFKEAELTGIPSTIFKLIKPQLEANNKRFLSGKQPKQNLNRSKPEASQKQDASKPEANTNDNGNNNKNGNEEVLVAKPKTKKLKQLSQVTLSDIQKWADTKYLEGKLSPDTDLELELEKCKNRFENESRTIGTVYNWILNAKDFKPPIAKQGSQQQRVQDAIMRGLHNAEQNQNN